MKLKKAIEGLGAKEAIVRAVQLADAEGIEWHSGARFVFAAVANDPERVPGNIGGKHDDENTAINKWLKKYQTGFNGRASKRISNPPGTISDPILEKIIGSRLTYLTQNELDKIIYAHRLGMSAENILGLILEEFLAVQLKEYGWHCA